ncbi:MAG: hypothetical protein IJT65_05540 [Eubacterium sp.]|nr:hypothetical protein [Eubacterium sp.]
MSKEKKLAKKEQKAAKKAAKLEKSQAAAYAKLVKKIDKKNAKLEKKANKKGKPFEPIPVPTQEEAFAPQSGGKVKKIILMIILILLIWLVVYFLVMAIKYVAPPASAEETTASEEGSPAEYDRYTNPHEITKTPIYSVSEAKVLLKQTLHDNYIGLGYSSDPSTGSINYTNNIMEINNQDCYIFTAGSKTYAVATNLSSVYVNKNGTFKPLTFHNDNYLF